MIITSHFSTHIDAPFHMIEDGKKLTDFPLGKFIGEAIIIDVRNKKQIKSNLNNVKENDIVFFYTGHTDKAYYNTFFRDNPVITKDIAKQLIDKKVKIVGLDSYSPDNEPFEIHKLFFKYDILIVENLVNLDKLNGKRFMCYILPLKIHDADGAPCRVIGILQ